MGFSRQEYWSGLPRPSPGDLPDLGIKPMSPALQADSLLSEPPEKPMKSNSEMKSLSRVRLFATPWTVAYQAPPSMGFSRQEYWSGLPFPSPEDLPDPGIEPKSPALQADSLLSEPPGGACLKLLKDLTTFFQLSRHLSCFRSSKRNIISERERETEECHVDIYLNGKCRWVEQGREKQRESDF